MKNNTRIDYYERITKVRLYIEENIDNTIGLDTLASVACLSPYHFHRVFKGMNNGQTVAEYIRRLRIERAALRLMYSQQSVTDIAFESGYETPESFSRAFKKRFGQLPSQYRKDPKQKLTMTQRADFFIKTNEQGTKMKEEVIIKQIDARKVVFMRHIGPYELCGTVWEKLCKTLIPKGFVDKDSIFLSRCYDDPEITEPEKLRCDACMTINTDITPEGELGVQEIPAGEFLTILHKGPYTTLKNTYAWLFGTYVPQNGIELKHDPSIEIYLNSPTNTAPEELLTEIQLALA